MKSILSSIAVLLLLSVASAHAFVQNRLASGGGYHWDLTNLPVNVHTNIVNRNTKAVRYFLATDGYSSTNTQAELNAIRASFAQWQSISNTILKFEEGGPASPRNSINTADNTNVIFWAKSSTVVGPGADISGALGVTFTTALQGGALDATLKEADIVFNGVDDQWITDFNNPTSLSYFVEGTALHELGHFIGLDHSALGGGTMFAYSDTGVSPQAGLSSDEVLAAQYIYRTSNVNPQRSWLKGQVTRFGTNIIGAVVTVEDTNGLLQACSVTRTNGYEVPLLLPGNYNVRVSPLDPNSSAEPLVSPQDISASGDYNAAETNFLPGTNTLVTLTAGATNTLNLVVLPFAPAFRISLIRGVTTNPGSYSWSGLPASALQGQANITMGVGSRNLPTSGATLSVTGDGLSIGSTTFLANAFGSGENFISVTLSVSSNATPGLRSFIVQQGTNRAVANGFFEVLPLRPDYNFDGLDDYFQRQYFPLFTATNAAPSADPDGDGFNNLSEYIAGSNPTNGASYLKISKVQQNASGTTLTWAGAARKKYQVLSKPVISSGTFTPLSTVFNATGTNVQYLDSGATSGIKFYRVQAIP
ncbi:MAG TPA: matrixin family metalloprotease [Candidatus Saccharimonadales bacterium]|nr:matrixin family metalloprotease [Candidatus Saccharimonadales bacterium]